MSAMPLPLWTSDAMRAAMRAEANAALPPAISGISIDTRTLAPGEAYFAIKGAVHDGHAFVDAALKAGASLAVVEKVQAEKFASDAPLLVVEDVLAAQGRTHASVASFNNHWGVPLSLARCPADARFAVFEIGMNHAGEIEPLV